MDYIGEVEKLRLARGGVMVAARKNEWEMAGIRPVDEAVSWEANGFPAVEARDWRATLLAPSEAKRWRENGFDAEEARAWIGAAWDDPDRALDWKRHGFGPFAASVWGCWFDNPWDAAGWRRAGYAASVAALCAAEGLAAGRAAGGAAK